MPEGRRSALRAVAVALIMVGLGVLAYLIMSVLGSLGNYGQFVWSFFTRFHPFILLTVVGAEAVLLGIYLHAKFDL